MKKFFRFLVVLCFGVCGSVYGQDIVSISKETNISGNINQLDSGAVQSVGITKEKKVQTVEELVSEADKGNVDAMLDLGYMHLYGVNGVNVDYQKALAYYEKASEKNSPVAYNNLGSLYFNGIGVETDRLKAISYFEKATELGSSDAAVNLAIIYLGDTDNVNETQYKKIKGLLMKAEGDNNIAKYLIGYSTYKGFLFDKNDKKAFLAIKAAADNEYDEAQVVLSEFYISGRGTPKNYNKAVEYLQKAVTQGNPDAILKLASILTEGKIYTQDIKRAHVLYNIAAVMGVGEAADKRDELEKNLSIEDLLTIQAEAENYQARSSALTDFVRQTFGNSLKAYIDSHIIDERAEEDKEVMSKK